LLKLVPDIKAHRGNEFAIVGIQLNKSDLKYINLNRVVKKIDELSYEIKANGISAKIPEIVEIDKAENNDLSKYLETFVERNKNIKETDYVKGSILEVLAFASITKQDIFYVEKYDSEYVDVDIVGDSKEIKYIRENGDINIQLRKIEEHLKMKKEKENEEIVNEIFGKKERESIIGRIKKFLLKW